MKPLIFALIVCIKMMRIALRSLRMFFVICLPWPPKNRFLCLTTNSMKQIDSVDMGSPLSQAVANIFKCSFENKWLKDCPHVLKPVFYRLYVDDIFVLFSSLDQAEKFKKYFSSKYPNIKFSLEKRNDGRLSFLDINIFCEKGKFVTNVYLKKTFSGVYTNFNSETCKTGLIESLLFRCFNLCSDCEMPSWNKYIERCLA